MLSLDVSLKPTVPPNHWVLWDLSSWMKRPEGKPHQLPVSFNQVEMQRAITPSPSRIIFRVLQEGLKPVRSKFLLKP